MSFARTSLVSILLFALSAKAASFNNINPEYIVQCQTIQLSFTGSAPFIVSVWHGCSEDATTETPIEQYHTNLTTVNWKVNVASGKHIMFGLRDKDWDWTTDYTVKAGDDPSCVGQRPSFSSPGATTTMSTTTTGAPGNAGGLSTTHMPTTTAAHPGGALSNFSPRVELVALVVLGSSLASLFWS